MSMADAMGRVQEIRSTLTTLAEPLAPVAAPKPADTAKASEFAQALTSATGGTQPTGTSSAITEAVAALAASQQAAPAVPSAAPVPPVAANTTGTATGSDVEAAAQKYLGLPYIWGGNDPAAGLDCSSFVQNVFKDLGYELPRTTWDQVNEGTPVASMADAKPGDLLFTFDTGHVSIYLGDGKAVDAPQPGQTIQVRDMWENDSNVTAIRRIIPDNANQAAAEQASFLAGAAA